MKTFILFTAITLTALFLASLSFAQSQASLIDTYIVSGPKNGEVIDKTNKVTFEFQGTIVSKSKKEIITFETKVVGLDKVWKGTSSGKRTIDFPAGPKVYTFLVRAKTKNLIDSTPAQRTFKINISPYFGKLKFASLSHPSITLTANLTETEKIDITNWKIKGNSGEITIPQGAELFIPASSIPNSDIIIGKADKVYLWSSSNPFKVNKNFRPNKCFGYLKDYYGSLPSISSGKICPKINLEDIDYLSDYCQDTVLKLQNCKAIDYSKDSKILFDSTCQAYIDNYRARYLNYNGCVETYSKDKDFFSKSWYVYVGYDIIRKRIDNFYLYDKDGLLVNVYNYRR